MISPGEHVMNEAEQKLSAKEEAERIFERRNELIGNIPSALEALPHKEYVEIRDYAANDQRTLDVTVMKELVKGPYASRDIVRLFISGKLVSQETERSVAMPMYRVTKILPFTDGGSLRPHYEIAVADPESKTGYRALALIEQEFLNPQSDKFAFTIGPSSRVGDDMFEAHDTLSPLDMAEIKKTGIYVDPHSQDMLAEVQGILRQAIEQKKVQA